MRSVLGLLLLMIGVIVMGCEDESPIAPVFKMEVPIINDATDIEATGFTASWSEVPYAEFYILDVSSSPEFRNYVEGFEKRVTYDTTIQVEGLLNDTHYFYRIMASGEKGSSVYSETASIRTVHIDYFNVIFNNEMHTDTEVTVANYGTEIVSPGQSITFRLLKSDGSYFYLAKTSCKTDQGDIVGLELEGYDTVEMTGDSDFIDLYYTEDVFFLKMINRGTYNLCPIYVNFGQSIQTEDLIVVPCDDTMYEIDYYEAYPTTVVAAYWLKSDNFSYWEQDVNFTFPMVNNQAITLINTSKKDVSYINSTEKRQVHEGTIRKALHISG